MPNQQQASPAPRLVRVPHAPVEAPVLDADQRAVVDHRGGPLLVLAGPGTGKTTTIAEAVVTRVERGEIAPEQALVLTFSRRAAGELRDRIAARLGRTIREPIARTFHSYAFGLLRAEAAARGEPAPRLLSGPEQDLVVRELLRGDVEAGAAGWPESLRPALLTLGFAQELRDLLQRAVERGVSPGMLVSLGRRWGRPDWVAAGGFARQYEQVSALREAASYDPAELIQAAVSLLRGQPELVVQVRARHRFVVVDEYQDTDPAQAQLLRLLAGSGELLVVGDPDQSIYSFRGADPDGIRQFPEAFRAPDGAPARVLSLRSCRRSGAGLLEASRRIAGRLGGTGPHRELAAPAGTPAGQLEVQLFGSAGAEAGYVANRLRQARLLDGFAWSRMAVLVRAAVSVPALRRALTAAGVPIAGRADDEPIVAVPIVRALLRVLEVGTGRIDLAGPIGPEVAHELLVGPLGGADPLTLRRLRQHLRSTELAAGGGRASGPLLAEALERPEELTGLPPRVAAPAQRVARVLAAVRTGPAAGVQSAEGLLWAAWEASGLARRWSAVALGGTGSQAVAADRDLDAVVALFDAAGRFADRLPRAGAGVFLDHLLGQQLPGDSLAPQAPGGEGVRLLTAHAAKGLEWDVVVVAGVQEGLWPDLRLRGSLLGTQQLVDVLDGTGGVAESGETQAQALALAARLAEERRLFYVAVTRARRLLIVTATRAEDEQPSRFIDELAPLDSDERPLTRSPRRLDLASLVAELRAAVTAEAPDRGRAGTATRRLAAAAQLTRLAAAGVRGADPGEWYGTLPLSDDGPLVRDGEPVRISPSRLESFDRCELRWLLEASGGTSGESAAQGVGTLIHALAEQAARDGLDAAALRARFGEAVRRVDLGSGWFAGRQRERAAGMVDKLAAWLRAGSREFLAAEQHFTVEMEGALLGGQVDRLERDAAGELVVVDFKTGKSQPKKAELGTNPQLGAYQLAVSAGAFDEVAGGVRESGGAELVQLGGKQQAASVQRQEPLPPGADSWAHQLVRRAATGMAGSAFDAIENDYCPMCPVRTCCPLQGEGRQVHP